jgi:hypothetical protein
MSQTPGTVTKESKLPRPAIPLFATGSVPYFLRLNHPYDALLFDAYHACNLKYPRFIYNQVIPRSGYEKPPQP